MGKAKPQNAARSFKIKVMKTKITGTYGFIDKYTYPKNTEIISELISIGKKEAVAKGIVARLQAIRHKHDFFSESFKTNFEKKFAFFQDCLKLLQDNHLPLNTGGLRDQCILRFLGPYFKLQRKQRLSKKTIINLKIEKDEILNLMDSYEVQSYDLKDLFYLDDNDITGSFFDMIFRKIKKDEPLPKFITAEEEQEVIIPQMEAGVFCDLNPPANIKGKTFYRIQCEYQHPNIPNEYVVKGIPENQTEAESFVLKFTRTGKVAPHRSDDQKKL